MTRRDVQGYAQDMVALSESQVKDGKSGKDTPKPPPAPKWPGPVRLPAPRPR